MTRSGIARWPALVRPAIAIAAGLLVLAVSATGLFETNELKIYDLRLRLRGEHPLHPSIVFVCMDEETRNALGGPGWARRRVHHGEIARALRHFGARFTAFDVVFSGGNEDDAEVAQNFREAGNVYLAHYFTFDDTGAPWDPAEVRDIEAWLAANPDAGVEECAAHFSRDPGLIAAAFEHARGLTAFRATSLGDATGPLETIWTASDVELPGLALHGSARGIGFTQLDPDADHRGVNRDGVARKYPLFMRHDGRLYPSLALALYLDATGADRGAIGIDPGRAVRLPRPGGPPLAVPVDAEGEFLIDWAGGWNRTAAPASLPYAGVLDSYYLAVNGLEPSLPESTLAKLRDAIVFVGDTALDTPDRRAIPFESWYPMVGFQANALSCLLTGDFVARAGGRAEAALVLALAAILGMVVPRLRPLWATVFAVALLGATLAALQWLLAGRGLWFGILAPALTIVLGQASLLLAGFELERREKRRVRKAFGHYVAPAVVDQVLRDPARLRLGGERREVSILFSDIRNFTTVSETLEPEELVAVINEYLTEMTNVVYRHQGTLDKFVGDAIMAVYGAPLDQPDHAELACRTAVEMMADLRRLCDRWEAAGRKPINIGIGINTGFAIAGNVGSLERMDYTVMGDTVNVASRLESANKELGTNIIISEVTYRKVADVAEARPLGGIHVKGRVGDIQVYELIAMKPRAGH